MNASAGRTHGDEKLHRGAVEFVQRTASLRRAWVLYGRGNAMFLENLQSWRLSADPLFAARDFIELTTAGNKLFFGETLIGGDNPYARDLVETLRRLIIRRITLLKGVGDEELCVLMEMLSQESKALLAGGGPVAFLRRANAGKVRVIENIYLKRVGQTGDIDLDEGKLTLDDLHFIRGQLGNMLSLAGEGFDLRNEERSLLSEVVEHPTFMGELLRELAEKDAGAAPEPIAAKGAAIAEMLNAFLVQLRKGGGIDETRLGKRISDAVRVLDEPTRLETLAAEFGTAGQVAPVLDSEVFDSRPEQVGRLVVGIFQRDPKEMRRASMLLRRLAPSEEARREVAARVREECGARGADADEAERVFLESLGPPEPPADADEAGAEPDAVRLAALLAPHAAVTTSGLLASLETGGEEERADQVLSALLAEGGATPKLAARAAARVREHAKGGFGGKARPLFDALLLLAEAGEKACVAAAGEIQGLCAEGVAEALLRSADSVEDRAALLTEIARRLPAERTGPLWAAVLGGDPEPMQALAEAARREPATVAGLLQHLFRDADASLIARAGEIMRELPGELSTPILAELCRHPDASIRLKAVSALAKAGGAQASPFVRVLVNDGDAEVRRTAIPLLGHCGGEGAEEALIEIAADARGVQGEQERALACRALAKCGGPRAVDALAAILRRTHGGPRGKDAQLLRSSARFALESIGGEAAQEALRGDAPPRRSLFGRLFGGG